MAKKFEKNSRYEKHDLDGDGIITDEELQTEERLIKLENADKMQDQQRLICWVSSLSSIGLILLVLSPIIPNNKVELCTALLSAYVVANLGIVSVFMGATSFTRIKENGHK